MLQALASMLSWVFRHMLLPSSDKPSDYEPFLQKAERENRLHIRVSRSYLPSSAQCRAQTQEEMKVYIEVMQTRYEEMKKEKDLLINQMNEKITVLPLPRLDVEMAVEFGRRTFTSQEGIASETETARRRATKED